MPKPNILYLHSHDTGRYIAPYGYAVPTPNLQALAEQGIVFRQAYNGGPTCSPSRAVLVTGQCAHSSGMIGLAHRGFSLNDYKKHIVHTLRKAGYRSTLVGVQHVAAEASVIGYDEVLAQGEDRHHAAQIAREWLRRRPQEPFFLSVGFSETHRVFPEPGPEDDPRFCQPPLPLPDTPETRRDMAAFKTSARTLDEKMGIVLKALDESGLAENTLVICTTDHGIAFPRMKCNLTDGGIGVMLIMRGPGGFSGGKVSDALVSHVDIFPTICDLLQIEPPEWLQGVSMLPLVRGEVQEIRDAIFSEVTYHASYEPMRCIRTKRWKYIRRFGDRRKVVLPNCDDSPSKSLLLEHGWAEHTYPEEELYDVIFDPAETDNLVGDPNVVDVLEELRARLQQWMHDTDDPLLQGFVPPPAGAIVNDPNGLSPRQTPLSAEEFVAMQQQRNQR